MKAVEKSLAEYERQVREKDVLPKDGKPGISTPELDALKARRDAAKDARDALRAADTAFQQKQASGRLADAIKELQEKITKGDIAPGPGKAPVTSPEIEGQRRQLKALQDALSDAREAAGLNDSKRLDAAMKAVDAAILKAQNAVANDLPAEKRTGITSPELEAKRRLLANLNKLLAGQRRKAPLSKEELAIRAARSRLSNRIAEAAEKIRQRDYAPRQKNASPDSPELFRLKAEADRYGMMLKNLAERERLKSRPLWEKSADNFYRYVRASVLSGPTTLVKLLSATAEQMAFKPIYELAGGVLSRVPGLRTIARQAQGEGGGFAARAYGRAYAKAFTLGISDAWKILRKGHVSDLDVTYGRMHQAPEENLVMSIGREELDDLVTSSDFAVQHVCDNCSHRKNFF